MTVMFNGGTGALVCTHCHKTLATGGPWTLGFCERQQAMAPIHWKRWLVASYVVDARSGEVYCTTACMHRGRRVEELERA